MDPKHLGLPSRYHMSAGARLDNHDYWDARKLTWGDFDDVYGEEPELLERLAEGDDLYEDTGCYNTLMLGLDPGIASAVVALAAARCVPMASCSGQPGHREQHPLVVFWCPAALFAMVEDAARRAAVSLDGCDVPGLMVHTERGNLSAMRTFATALAVRARRPEPGLAASLREMEAGLGAKTPRPKTERS